MKTSTKTLFATGLIALVISTSTVYAKDGLNSTTVTASAVNISSVKKLVITGNAEVTILQDAKSKVLYSNDGEGKVSVKKIGDAVFVDSKTNGKITIYVDEIYRIEASENAAVYTNSNLTLKYLQVFLKDNAQVDLNANTENLFTDIKNSAKLMLKGNTDLYTIAMDKSATISLDKFRTKKTEMNSDVYVASRG